MAKTGFGVQSSWFADNVNRVPSAGKNAMIAEFVEAPAIDGLLTLYNSNKTAYSSVPTDATTGGAILGSIKHVVGVSAIYIGSSANALTTTLNTQNPGVYIVNGPTTLAYLGVHNNLDGYIYRVIVFGKAF